MKNYGKRLTSEMSSRLVVKHPLPKLLDQALCTENEERAAVIMQIELATATKSSVSLGWRCQSTKVWKRDIEEEWNGYQQNPLPKQTDQAQPTNKKIWAFQKYGMGLVKEGFLPKANSVITKH